MEQWEKEYIEAVTKSKQGKSFDCACEEGYDSSRWVEITLPDGKILHTKRICGQQEP